MPGLPEPRLERALPGPASLPGGARVPAPAGWPRPVETDDGTSVTSLYVSLSWEDHRSVRQGGPGDKGRAET